MYNFMKKINLVGYEDFFYYFVDLYNKKKSPNKIILSGSKGIGKSTFAKYLINYFLTEKTTTDYRNFLNTDIILQKFLNQNFFHIDLKEEKKIIEIDQVRNLINYSQKKSMNNLPRYILIDNIEKLNKNASNALLKILEEPNDNMYFILIHDSRFKILETINSRCLNFKISFSHTKKVEFTNQILGINIYDYLNKNLITNYSSISDLINIYNFSIINKINLKDISVKNVIKILIDDKKYKADNNAHIMLVNLIENFLYTKFMSSKDIKFYNFYKYFTQKYFYANKYNLDIETLFLDIRNKAFSE